MNKTIVTIIIIAVVLVGGYFLFFRGASQQTPSVLEPSSQQPITLPPASEQPSQQPPASQVPAVKENVVTIVKVNNYFISRDRPIPILFNTSCLAAKNQSSVPALRLKVRYPAL